jgi:adenylate cyclase
MMLQTGETFWRRRLNGSAEDEFSLLPQWRAEGMTDYIAIITRFAAEGSIGEMDGIYSAWATKEPQGFTDDQIAALKRIVPYLALAIKSVSLARMIRTLMETYLGRDAGQRVLSGRIVRGIAQQIDAVVKPQISFPLCEPQTARGRNSYPRKSNLTFGYIPLRFPSLQYTILVLVGCSLV